LCSPDQAPIAGDLAIGDISALKREG